MTLGTFDAVFGGHDATQLSSCHLQLLHIHVRVNQSEGNPQCLGRFIELGLIHLIGTIKQVVDDVLRRLRVLLGFVQDFVAWPVFSHGLLSSLFECRSL
jgi:hypothetical protein